MIKCHFDKRYGMNSFLNDLYKKFEPKGKFVFHIYPKYASQLFAKLALMTPSIVGLIIMLASGNKPIEQIIPSLLVFPGISFLAYLAAYEAVRSIVTNIQDERIKKAQTEITHYLQSNQDNEQIKETLYQINLLYVCMLNSTYFQNKKNVPPILNLLEQKIVFSDSVKALSIIIANNPEKMLKTYESLKDYSIAQLEEKAKKHVASILAAEEDLQNQVSNFVSKNNEAKPSSKEETIFNTNKNLTVSL